MPPPESASTSLFKAVDAQSVLDQAMQFTTHICNLHAEASRLGSQSSQPLLGSCAHEWAMLARLNGIKGSLMIIRCKPAVIQGSRVMWRRPAPYSRPAFCHQVKLAERQN